MVPVFLDGKKMRRRTLILLGCFLASSGAASVFATSNAIADDILKVAIGQINNWDNQIPQLGQRAGIFKKHGLILQIIGTQGAGETLQAVNSGIDIGIGCRDCRCNARLYKGRQYPCD